MFGRVNKFIKKTFFLLAFLIGFALIINVALVSLYPLAYVEYIINYSREYELDPFLVAAIINVESSYDKNAISHREARGLMQIGPRTGRWASEELGIESYEESMLFDPMTNIRIGTWYLNNLNKEFKGNQNLILAAYNAGSGNVQKWRIDKDCSLDGENLYNIPFKETEEYLKKVKKNHRIYRIMYKESIYEKEYDPKYVDFINSIRRYLKQTSISLNKNYTMLKSISLEF